MADRELWVFMEQRGRVLHDVGFELLGKARDLARDAGREVCGLLLGSGIAGLTDQLFLHGAQRVIVAQDDRFEPYRLMPYVSLLERLCRERNPDAVLFGATSMGVELAPRLAARLRTGLSAHCIDLNMDEDGNLLQMVPGWGGGVVATIKCPDHRPQMATVMPGVFKKKSYPDGKGEVLTYDPGDDLETSGPRVLEVHREEPRGVPLDKAEVVVSGGWGIGGQEGWGLVEELAEVLCGAVGATRPPVDEGWAGEDQMIGQSGKVVRPRLYIGVGISGMMHHVVGMDESGYIVAINTDPGAPIFEISDLSVVGDYRVILPALIEEIKKRRFGALDPDRCEVTE